MIQLCPQNCLSLRSIWHQTQPLSAGYSNAQDFFPVVHWNFTGVPRKDATVSSLQSVQHYPSHVRCNTYAIVLIDTNFYTFFVQANQPTPWNTGVRKKLTGMDPNIHVHRWQESINANIASAMVICCSSVMTMGRHTHVYYYMCAVHPTKTSCCVIQHCLL